MISTLTFKTLEDQAAAEQAVKDDYAAGVLCAGSFEGFLDEAAVHCPITAIALRLTGKHGWEGGVGFDITPDLDAFYGPLDSLSSEGAGAVKISPKSMDFALQQIRDARIG